MTARHRGLAFLFVVPAVLLVAVLMYYPMLRSVYESLFATSFINPEAEVCRTGFLCQNIMGSGVSSSRLEFAGVDIPGCAPAECDGVFDSLVFEPALDWTGFDPVAGLASMGVTRGCGRNCLAVYLRPTTGITQ